MIVATTA